MSRYKALEIKQWLNEWNEVDFNSDQRRRKPDESFYIASIPASVLTRLSNVYRRSAVGARIDDESIQRKSSSERVDEISRFINGGYPWSDLSERQRRMVEFQDLRMPGWLPTAIVANILAPDSQRLGQSISPRDTIKINKEVGHDIYIELPIDFHSPDWQPVVRPLEIIDGQHRLLAFEENEMREDFDIPVVLFYNLDITWQAYLFYTINIKPKRINTSLAFDLYPLLRIQDWLEKSSNAPAIYRETRAQELTEILWSHPESAWRDRIAMLGEDSTKVSQAAFIRSLVNTYIKRWDSKEIGGLFGGAVNHSHGEVLAWTRSQQAAFLLVFFEAFFDSVRNKVDGWAEYLRKLDQQPLLRQDISLDDAIWGRYSLINSDQGVRGLLQISNDIFYILSIPLGLANWKTDVSLESEVIDPINIKNSIDSLKSCRFYPTIQSLSRELVKFDWRSPVTPGLNDSDRIAQQGFKGSSGYRELRRRLAALLVESEDRDIGEAARNIMARIA